MRRRRAVVEGSFGDAANNQSYKHSRWRGLERMIIQNLLIATIQNLRKLLIVNLLRPAASMAKSTNSVLHNISCAILSRLICYRMVSIANQSEYSVFKELYQLFRFKLLFL
jgi:hypothetical protein